MNAFSIQIFHELMKTITKAINNHPLDKNLEKTLNKLYPPDSDTFISIKASCLAGIESGDLCQHHAASISFGQIIKPSEAFRGFSVDLVQMKEVIGPYHSHPLGEIDLIMPINNSANFDDHGAGWLVYEPDSAHEPTVRNGEALILYLLPNGKIEFTRK